MFARIENNQVAEYPLTEREIKDRFPNRSFPTEFASWLPEGYVRVTPTSHDGNDLKVYSEATPVFAGGEWTQAWTATDKHTPAELAALEQEKVQTKLTRLREQRDSLIRTSSWIVERHRDQKDAGAVTSITEVEYLAWLSYRQALRDLPSMVTNIDSINWPKPPGQLGVSGV